MLPTSVFTSFLATSTLDIHVGDFQRPDRTAVIIIFKRTLIRLRMIIFRCISRKWTIVTRRRSRFMVTIYRLHPPIKLILDKNYVTFTTSPKMPYFTTLRSPSLTFTNNLDVYETLHFADVDCDLPTSQHLDGQREEEGGRLGLTQRGVFGSDPGTVHGLFPFL